MILGPKTLRQVLLRGGGGVGGEVLTMKRLGRRGICLHWLPLVNMNIAYKMRPQKVREMSKVWNRPMCACHVNDMYILCTLNVHVAFMTFTYTYVHTCQLTIKYMLSTASQVDVNYTSCTCRVHIMYVLMIYKCTCYVNVTLHHSSI